MVGITSPATAVSGFCSVSRAHTTMLRAITPTSSFISFSKFV